MYTEHEYSSELSTTKDIYIYIYTDGCSSCLWCVGYIKKRVCLRAFVRFRPHQDADPSRPRVAAVIDTLISFKNNDLGAWIRGGDIVIKDSG